MTSIWKCGFCDLTHYKYSIMQKHESMCPSNPRNKLCFSCDNHIPGVNMCSENIMTYNVYTSATPCSRWSGKKQN